MELHAAVVPKVHSRIKEFLSTSPSIRVEEIAEFYAEEFANFRRRRAERMYLSPLGLTAESFLSAQSDMLQELAFDLTNKMLNEVMHSEAIIAGVDETGGHIYKIHDPGLATCFDTPFFAAIGIGENHAISQFMLAKFEKRWSVEKTIYLTYSAKTLAEATAGVGKQTDMVLIRPGTPIYPLKGSEIATLDAILKQTTSKGDEALTCPRDFGPAIT